MEVYLSKLYTLIGFGDAAPSVPSFIGSKVIFWWISCVRSGHISWQISFTFCTDVHHSQIYTPVCFGDAAPSVPSFIGSKVRFWFTYLCCGDENFNARKVIRRILYIKRCSTGSQWRLLVLNSPGPGALAAISTSSFCLTVGGGGGLSLLRTKGWRKSFVWGGGGGGLSLLRTASAGGYIRIARQCRFLVIIIY